MALLTTLGLDIEVNSTYVQEFQVWGKIGCHMNLFRFRNIPLEPMLSGQC